MYTQSATVFVFDLDELRFPPYNLDTLIDDVLGRYYPAFYFSDPHFRDHITDLIIQIELHEQQVLDFESQLQCAVTLPTLRMALRQNPQTQHLRQWLFHNVTQRMPPELSGACALIHRRQDNLYLFVLQLQPQQ